MTKFACVAGGANRLPTRIPAELRPRRRNHRSDPHPRCAEPRRVVARPSSPTGSRGWTGNRARTAGTRVVGVPVYLHITGARGSRQWGSLRSGAHRHAHPLACRRRARTAGSPSQLLSEPRQHTDHSHAISSSPAHPRDFEATTSPASGARRRHPPSPVIVGPVTHHRDVDGELPPLPPADASDDERGRALMARFVARHGAPSLEDYRRAYAGFGVDWPGDDVIRARHPVAG